MNSDLVHRLILSAIRADDAGAWLLVYEAVADQTSVWKQSFHTLEVDDRFAAIDALREPNTGLVGAYLLGMLTEGVIEEPDEGVAHYLSREVGVAIDQLEARHSHLRRQVESSVPSPFTDQELIRLDEELSIRRADAKRLESELGSFGDALRTMRDLDRRIDAAKQRLSALNAFDRQGRESDLQRTLAEAKEIEDANEQLRAELKAAAQRLSQVQSESAEAQKQLSEATRSADEASKTRDRVVAETEVARRDSDAAHREARTKREELEAIFAASPAPAMDGIRRKIRDILAELPQDELDRQMPTPK